MCEPVSAFGRVGVSLFLNVVYYLFKVGQLIFSHLFPQSAQLVDYFEGGDKFLKELPGGKNNALNMYKYSS